MNVLWVEFFYNPLVKPYKTYNCDEHLYISDEQK